MYKVGIVMRVLVLSCSSITLVQFTLEQIHLRVLRLVHMTRVSGQLSVLHCAFPPSCHTPHT